MAVDDAKAIRDILSKMLSSMGFEVAVARSGHQGLNLFLKNSFDLVLADLQMPDMDGWTLAPRIKDESSDTPIVLVTGDEKGRVMEKLEERCVDSVVVKPFLHWKISRKRFRKCWTRVHCTGDTALTLRSGFFPQEMRAE